VQNKKNYLSLQTNLYIPKKIKTVLIRLFHILFFRAKSSSFFVAKVERSAACGRLRGQHAGVLAKGFQTNLPFSSSAPNKKSICSNLPFAHPSLCALEPAP